MYRITGRCIYHDAQLLLNSENIVFAINSTANSLDIEPRDMFYCPALSEVHTAAEQDRCEISHTYAFEEEKS